VASIESTIAESIRSVIVALHQASRAVYHGLRYSKLS
jgi:hypothetical protein